MRANELVTIGFFEPRGTRQAPEYWVPFLYRDAWISFKGLRNEALGRMAAAAAGP